MIDAKTFASIFAGFNIVDCTIRSPDILYVLLCEDYTQWTDWKEMGLTPAEDGLEKRLVGFRGKLDDPWSIDGSLYPFEVGHLGIATQPEPKAIVISSTGEVYSSGSGVNGSEQSPTKDDNVNRGGVHKTRTFDGWLYACTGNRGLMKRKGPGQWIGLSHNFPLPPLREGSTRLRERSGFRDFDGFCATDIYLAGGNGDLWHYNGQDARQIDFPSNVPLVSICCGGDGQVYVAGAIDLLFCGRGDTWKTIETPNLSVHLRQLAWFEDKLWATNDYGIWWVEGNKLVPARIPAEAKIASGYMSVAHGTLMLAGQNGDVALYRDGVWTTLVNAVTMYGQCREQGLLKDVLRERWKYFQPDWTD